MCEAPQYAFYRGTNSHPLRLIEQCAIVIILKPDSRCSQRAWQSRYRLFPRKRRSHSPSKSQPSSRLSLPSPANFSGRRCAFGMQVDASRVTMQFMSMMDILAAAYFRVKPYQVSGPSWLSTERFDIVAKIPEGVPQDKVPEMLQSLLADRFKLTMHRDNKEQGGLCAGGRKGRTETSRSPRP